MNNSELEQEPPAASNVITMLFQETIAKEVERLKKKLNKDQRESAYVKHNKLCNVSRSSERRRFSFSSTTWESSS